MRAALLAVAIMFAAAPDMSGAADAQPYWKQRGCDHGHRSSVAYKRTTALLKNQTPFTKDEGRKVRHYAACVATRKKSRAVERHVGRLKEWRGSDVCTAARGNAALGRCMAFRDHGWGADQFACLNELWGNRESHWSVYAHNASSGAHGIPQALPGWKMGPGWYDDPVVQIDWGLDYIAGRFGTPCGALAHSTAVGWY